MRIVLIYRGKRIFCRKGYCNFRSMFFAKSPYNGFFELQKPTHKMHEKITQLKIISPFLLF